VARFDDADPPNTTTRWRFDADPDCAAAECTNTAGRIASVTYPVGIAGIDAGADRFGYDARGREVFAARRLGDVDLPVHRTFDAGERITGLAYPEGTTLALSYDGIDRLTAIAGFFNQITWDDRGDLAGVAYANGANEARTYDADLRLATLTVNDAAGTPVLGLAFRYDREGNVREITDSAASRPGARSRALRVEDDDWYRPTKVTYDDSSEEVDSTFDLLDGVRSRTSSLGADSAANVGDLAYDDAHHTRVKTAGDVELAYDAAGDVTRRGQQTLAWDFRGRLVGTQTGDATFAAAYGPDDAPVVTLDGGELTLYGFDDFEVRDGVAYTYVRVDDRRAARRASPDFGTHVYPDLAPAGDDGTPAPDGAISAADAWMAWARGAGVIGGGDAGADVDLLLAAAARRVVAENADATAWLHADDLDDIVAATDEGGEVTGLRDFYAYGAPRWETGYVDPYGYTGQQAFAATGLVHFQYRQLDPWSGRWMSPDPAYAVVGGEQVVDDPSDALTGYAYVGNDPLSHVDPNGLSKKKNKSSHTDESKIHHPQPVQEEHHIGKERKMKILRGESAPTDVESRALSVEERKLAKSNRAERKAVKSIFVQGTTRARAKLLATHEGTTHVARHARLAGRISVGVISAILVGGLIGGIYGAVKAPNATAKTPYQTPGVPDQYSGNKPPANNNSSSNNSSSNNSGSNNSSGSSSGDNSGGAQ
jgi:RHS repeat-associated protein